MSCMWRASAARDVIDRRTATVTFDMTGARATQMRVLTTFCNLAGPGRRDATWYEYGIAPQYLSACANLEVSELLDFLIT